MVGVYKFWRSQAPYDKASSAVDSRLLPSVMAASDERANVGMWATTFFCTILSCNLLGLVPFNEAPTSGLGFATGLGISTWATATALGFYKLGFSFPGHFIPGAHAPLSYRVLLSAS
jgi:F0F1-type ATP synthase membrane subunit a